MASPSARPYHHGRLREAVLEAAVAEIEAVGPARLSMREIARRAGVSHAAPAHHFGDKAGIFTAIAIEGYRLIGEATSRAAVGDNALLDGGMAYVRFALTHRAHFEVMFRPDLYRADDPELVATRDATFGILQGAVEAGQPRGDPADVLGTVLASWSAAHGFAVLWLNGNLPPEVVADPDAITPLLARGLVALGEIMRNQMPS
jgi:AcrR family transcriptional regulator